MQATDSLSDHVAVYVNRGEDNDRIWELFSQRANEVPFLKTHRDYIEEHALGFGDRAFHYMWFLLLSELRDKGGNINLLEIGVYKGQIISLWSLIAARLGFNPAIYAITPLDGNITPSRLINNRIVNKFRRLLSPEFRKKYAEGNIYPRGNYRGIIASLFDRFSLGFADVILIKGFSNDKHVLQRVEGMTFDAIYIDGDHSLEGATRDILTYSKLIVPGGYLVVDDGSFFLEGSRFWKGHEAVSKACHVVEGLEFDNVLNVGHNRVYRKRS